MFHFSFVELVFSGFLRKLAQCEGSTINASIRDPSKATVTTKGITSINFPKVPEILSIGKKAAMVVKVDATIGQNTSFAPSFDAAIGSMPFSICL